MVPVKVVRLTKTQFVTEDDKRYKRAASGYIDPEMGVKYSGVGHRGEAYLQGKDQTKEMQAFRKRVRTISHINNLDKDLQELEKLLEKVKKETLKEKEKYRTFKM